MSEETKPPATAPAVASSELLDHAWEQFKAADENNRLRLGDAADALLSICRLIEQLPASPLQTEISLRASELRRRMADQASSGYTFECLCEICGKQFKLPHRDAPHRCGCDRPNTEVSERGAADSPTQNGEAPRASLD